jgi:hypothetical protein
MGNRVLKAGDGFFVPEIVIIPIPLGQKGQKSSNSAIKRNLIFRLLTVPLNTGQNWLRLFHQIKVNGKVKHRQFG